MTDAPVFLTLDEVLLLHELSLEVFGGKSGIRDKALLESAVSQPQLGTSAGYLHSYPYEMAAAYGFHLARNHPFVDGNKRTAWSAMRVFLLNNGYDLRTEFADAVATMLGVAAGDVDKAQFASWITKLATPRP